MSDVILNIDGIRCVEQIEWSIAHALASISATCPSGREMALVKTKLQEAEFWAIESIKAAKQFTEVK
jgi:hypothetical protein